MDTGLTREESQTLLQLLNLGPESYGNWGLMRKAFLSKCKELHPDKGGDPEKAKLLISLYKKLEANVTTLNPEESFSTSEVGETNFFMYLKDWRECNMGYKECYCLFCLTRHKHRHRDHKDKPLFWGSCYCFKCFCLWFGMEWSYKSFLDWKEIVGQLPYNHLNL
ncbi:small T antigen [Rousettus aegyptiacus polyomavirus 1]|uniref:Small T antigen n=1 Tax=Rousettus aegyptiacus polyomavirus 1 TaxID=1904411 RepID=A0A1S7J034_9POLY|nr:small T antigen [Rousettus aegyptiacus polyomavirus 1]BAX01895.1 small T antigen [Rousettus aegyptiacus polyomavirus 1]